MIRLAAENTPVDLAWAAFDAAAISFYALYGDAGRAEGNVPQMSSAERREAAQEVVRLWNEWRTLFVGDGDPRPAA